MAYLEITPQAIEEYAQQLEYCAALSRQLAKSMKLRKCKTFTTHFSKAGNGLEDAMDSVHKAIKAWESKLFSDYGLAGSDASLKIPNRPKTPAWDAAWKEYQENYTRRKASD